MKNYPGMYHNPLPKKGNPFKSSPQKTPQRNSNAITTKASYKTFVPYSSPLTR
jgi:hypothetical protein